MPAGPNSARRALLQPSALPSLRFFEAAARLESFKHAAVELHVTQGAVSQQIKHLERVLGFKLFYRLPRRIELTEEGRRFAAVVTQSLDRVEQEAHALAQSHSAVGVRLRTGPSFAARWLVPRLEAFYAKHPRMKLSITAAYGYFESAGREFDLAIEMTATKLPGLECEKLMDEYLLPVCSPAYLARHRFLKKPADLARCTLLHDADPWTGADPDSEWRHWLREVHVASHVDSTQGRTFSLMSLAIEAALTDQGVALGRHALIEPLLHSGHLVAPFPQRVRSPVSHQLIFLPEMKSRPAVQAVIAWLHEEAKRQPQSAGSGANIRLPS